MKLEPSIIIAMVKRKGITLAAGMALGAVLCAEYPDVFALVQQAVGVIGAAGAVGAIASILMSVKNEQEGVKDVAEALATPPPGATICSCEKGNPE